MDLAQPAAPPSLPADGEVKHGGATRFELELEFVQCLGNPFYLNHLASQKLLANPAFVAYLDYLQYWTTPQYVKYLAFPATTMKALQLLQTERFRRDIISPELTAMVAQEWTKAAVDWHREEK